MARPGDGSYSNRRPIGVDMNQEDFEALMTRLDEVFEEIRRSRQAIEWLEDHCPDDHLSSNLGLIRKNLGQLEYKFHELMGRPLDQACPSLLQDCPFD